MSIDINSILAKYGNKKPKPAFSPQRNQQVVNKPSQNLDNLNNSKEVVLQSYPVDQQISNAYYQKFIQDHDTPTQKPFDEPLNQMNLSQLQASVHNTVHQFNEVSHTQQKPKENSQISSDNLGIIQDQVNEIRQDINALHRDLLTLTATENSHFNQLSDMLKLILQRTE